MIGHHARGEGVARRGDEDAGELGEEEVGVRGDGVIELCLAEGEESCVLVRSGLDSLAMCVIRVAGFRDGKLAVLSKRAS